jgi:hypothetical protein
MTATMYRVIIEDKYDKVRERKDGFETWEKANKYGERHAKDNRRNHESYNVQTYWGVKP